jgi:DNA-3-methyladenine glycosylase I
MLRYHDEEWGEPLHDDLALFELLTLEGAQAGLSWETVLRRREGYRHAFEGFEIERVAALGEADVERLMQDAGIIRNRAKIMATIGNARAVSAIQAEFGSLDAFLWGFVGGHPRINRFEALVELPAQTAESAALSKDLQRRGFRFVGPTICYAFMQASGMVNDHVVGCFRWKQVQGGPAADRAHPHPNPLPGQGEGMPDANRSPAV